MASVYYNEFDAKKAAWLSQLQSDGHLAEGVTDARDIRDVLPDELTEFERCHFFAGIGGWELACDWAGWEGPIWTASCPCQPFSAAGKRAGLADERHLFPSFHWLIDQCRPPVIVGEQVASKDGLEWLDTVFARLESSGYTCGAADLCAAGVGAPHIRQRLYWVAYTEKTGRKCQPNLQSSGILCEALAERSAKHGLGARGAGNVGGLGDAKSGRTKPSEAGLHAIPIMPSEADGRGCERVDLKWLGDADKKRYLNEKTEQELGWERHMLAGKLNSWDSPDWARCVDPRNGRETYRPVEPGLVPLAHGVPARVVRISGYGDAIVPQLAATFLKSVMDVLQ